MFWSRLLGWCKERWELITGFLVGVLAVVAAVKSNSSKNILEEKNKLRTKTEDVKDSARKNLEDSLNKNIHKFLEEDEVIKEDLQQKLDSLNREKKDKIEELLGSDSPENDIANALKELLK
jgi:hypothetical protein